MNALFIALLIIFTPALVACAVVLSVILAVLLVLFVAMIGFKVLEVLT